MDIALSAAAAIRVRTAIFVFAAGASGVARADSYGPMAEDLLYRPGRDAGNLEALAQWLFYMLAASVGGWALWRLKRHVEASQPGGLMTPVVGIAFAAALAAVPMLIDALAEGLSPGYRPPAWPAE